MQSPPESVTSYWKTLIGLQTSCTPTHYRALRMSKNQGEPPLQPRYPDISRSSTRPSVASPQNCPDLSALLYTSFDPGNRCLNNGLGGILPEFEEINRELLDHEGRQTPHKLARTERSFVMFCKEPPRFTHSTPDGQPSCKHMRKQKRGYQIKSPLRPSSQDVGLVCQESNHG